ncbi:MAG: hypothetical protein R3Y33_06170 [Clostridia bacterium]
MKKIITSIFTVFLLTTILTACESINVPEIDDLFSSSSSEEESTSSTYSQEESDELSSESESLDYSTNVEVYASIVSEMMNSSSLLSDDLRLEVTAEGNVLVYTYFLLDIDENSDLELMAEEIIANLELNGTVSVYDAMKLECTVLEGVQYRYFTDSGTFITKWNLPTSEETEANEEILEYAELVNADFETSSTDDVTIKASAEGSVLIFTYIVHNIETGTDLEALGEQVIISLEASFTVDTFNAMQLECPQMEGLQFRYYDDAGSVIAIWDIPTE